MPLLRRMAEDSYREGRSSVLELLDASRTWREIAELRIHQRELARLAEEDVVAAAGLDAPAP